MTTRTYELMLNQSRIRHQYSPPKKRNPYRPRQVKYIYQESKDKEIKRLGEIINQHFNFYESNTNHSFDIGESTSN